MGSTFRRLHIVGDVPGDLAKRMEAFKFRPIDVHDVEQTTSAGWVPPDWAEGALVDSTWAQIRVDTLRISKQVVKQEVDERSVLAARALQVEKLTRQQREELEADVRRELRARIPPVPRKFLVSIYPPSGHVWIFGGDRDVEVAEELLSKVLGDECRLLPDWAFVRACREYCGSVTGPTLGEICSLPRFSAAPDSVKHLHTICDAEAGKMAPLDLYGVTMHLGAEFLLWLWWRAVYGTAPFDVRLVNGTTRVDVITGDRVTLSGGGDPQVDKFSGGDPFSSKEALEALRRGKMPSSVRLGVTVDHLEWSFTLDADLKLSAVNLPASLQAGAPERFDEVVYLLDKLTDVIDALFVEFVGEVGDSCEEVHGDIVHWVGSGA